MIASVVAALRAAGLRNDGTPLDTASTPDRATAPDENARRSIMMPSALPPSASSWASSDSVSSGIGAEVLDEDAVAADDDQQHQHHDVEVRRWREQRARLLQAAQVGHRHHGDQQQAQRHPPLASKSNADWMASTPPATDTATVRM